MTDSEKREYVGEFCRKLLSKLREAIPLSKDIIPTPEDGVIVYHGTDGNFPPHWISVQRAEGWPGEVYAWCSMLPLTHVDDKYRHVESKETRKMVLETARAVLDKLLKEYSHVDLSTDSICDSDFWNGGFIHSDGKISTAKWDDEDTEIDGYAQIVFDPEAFGWKELGGDDHGDD